MTAFSDLLRRDRERYGLRVVNIYRVVLRGSTPFKVVLVAQYTAATPFPAAAFEEDVR